MRWHALAPDASVVLSNAGFLTRLFAKNAVNVCVRVRLTVGFSDRPDGKRGDTVFQDGRLDSAPLWQTLVSMSDTLTLGKRRTIRFSKEDDSRIEAQAQAQKRSVSEVIRETVRQSLHGEEPCAGDWILQVAKSPPPKARTDPASVAFRQSYKERHP